MFHVLKKVIYYWNAIKKMIDSPSEEYYKQSL